MIARPRSRFLFSFRPPHGFFLLPSTPLDSQKTRRNEPYLSPAETEEGGRPSLSLSLSLCVFSFLSETDFEQSKNDVKRAPAKKNVSRLSLFSPTAAPRRPKALAAASARLSVPASFSFSPIGPPFFRLQDPSTRTNPARARTWREQTTLSPAVLPKKATDEGLSREKPRGRAPQGHWNWRLDREETSLRAQAGVRGNGSAHRGRRRVRVRVQVGLSSLFSSLFSPLSQRLKLSSAFGGENAPP